MSEEFVPIHTQEELNARIKDRLERERKSVSAQFADYDAYKSKAEKYDTDTSELNTRIAELTATIADRDSQIANRDSTIKKYQVDSMKSKIASELGIPAAMAARITGETEDDIRKDAESISGLLKSLNKGYPQRDHAEPIEDAKEAAIKRMISNMG